MSSESIAPNVSQPGGSTEMAETYPQWWVQRSCIHWDAAKNKRFRLLRIDGPIGFAGGYPATTYDADAGRMLDNATVVRGGELLRRARADEVPAFGQRDLFRGGMTTVKSVAQTAAPIATDGGV